jgi:uncharacterized repeat protein (TIGR03803 family)
MINMTSQLLKILNSGVHPGIKAYSMKSNLILMTGIFVAWFGLVAAASAETFTSLLSFDDSVAATIYGGVAISGNTLYGTAYNGSTNGYNGSVYSYTLDGAVNALHLFSGADGQNPVGGVTIAGNTLYGTTQMGGTNHGGVIFKMDLNGSNYMVLKHFSDPQSASGAYPSAGLVLANDLLYGTCARGGAGFGLIFSIKTNGADYTPMRTFAGTDGGYPQAALVLSGDTLYGTATTGSGIGQYGTVFKINTNGTGYSTVHTFAPSEGIYPNSSVVVSGGVVYGTSRAGGSFGEGTVFRVNTDGNNFTNLHHFDGTNGGQTFSGLTLAGSVLYGACSSGGKYGQGNLFRINPDGTGFTVISDFNGTNGSDPYASMILVSNILYGTTDVGGSESNGTIFQLALDQGPSASSITLHPVSGAKIQLDYTGNPGTNYVLEAAYSLSSPVTWAPIATNIAANDGSIHFTNTVTATNTYWRIRSSP